MLLSLILVSVVGVHAGGGPIFTQGPDGSGKVGFTPPDLSDENTHSKFLPDKQRCDGCKAVAYQMFKAFREIDRKRPTLKGVFPESLIFKITGEVCEGEKAFEKYGLRSINDEQQLIGPAMDVADDAPGVKQEGGMWPSRLRDMCNEFIDLRGDDDLFHHYRNNDLESYTKYLCYEDDKANQKDAICKSQGAYKLPDKLKSEDINALKHEGAEEYYADEYDEDYNEDYYGDYPEDDDDDHDEGEPSRMKRSAGNH